MERVMAPRESANLRELVRHGAAATFTDEYNVKLRRLFPWAGVAETKRPMGELGVTWVQVPPHGFEDENGRDVESAFIVVSGRGLIVMLGDTIELRAGDVVYIPRTTRRQLKNTGDESFVFIDVCWDAARTPSPTAAE